MAIQLDLTLAQHPDASTTAALDALWKQINAFGAHLEGLSFSEIQARIEAYEAQIVALVRKDFPKTTTTTTPSSPASPSASVSTVSSAGPGSAAPASGAPASDAPTVTDTPVDPSPAPSSTSPSTSAAPSSSSVPESSPAAAGTGTP